MKLLVLTSEAISGEQLRDALPGALDVENLEVMVIAPALHESPLKFWFSDADDAIAKADDVRRSTVEQLGEAGVAASSDTGEGDPLEAIQDALGSFPADRILLFTHRDSEQRYREDVDLEEIKERFGLPASRASVGSSAAD